MIIEVFLAMLQGMTEFLPVSSSGHLAIASNLLGEPNLFLFTTLHLASLVAVLIYTRKEIFGILKFNKDSRKMIIYLVVATIPAALFGFFFADVIEAVFSSYVLIAIAFFFTGFVLLMTQRTRAYSRLNLKNAFIIGIFQILALFPGVSRSGMTISSGLVLGIEREKAAKFSFLLLIPLVIGAFIIQMSVAYFSFELVVAFLICLVTSLLFLDVVTRIVKSGNFWLFYAYCFGMGLLSLVLYFL